MVKYPCSVSIYFYYLLTRGQLEHYRGVLSKQRVYSLCNTIQGEGYGLKKRKELNGKLNQLIQTTLQSSFSI